MRLVLIHGFTQTGRSWDPLRPALTRDSAGGPEIVTPDVPGHGANTTQATDLPTTAAIMARSHGPAVWIGYSMGGRLALHIALGHPDSTTGLVLVSSSPGIADPVARAARRQADDELAAEIEAGTTEAFVERWLAGPLFATLPRDRAGIPERLTNTSAGLASSLRLAGTGAQADLWPRLHELTMPVLIVTGDQDEKFTAIGAEMAASIPTATHARIARAGHAVPWEQPDAFVAAVHGWIRRARARDQT